MADATRLSTLAAFNIELASEANPAINCTLFKEALDRSHNLIDRGFSKGFGLGRYTCQLISSK